MRNFNEHDDEPEDGWDDDEEASYINCPHCGKTLLEDADYCPTCDTWITDAAPKKKPYYWWVAAIVVILIATIILQTL